MRFQEQTEGITQIQPKHDSTRQIAYQSHGCPMQAWEPVSYTHLTLPTT